MATQTATLHAGSAFAPKPTSSIAPPYSPGERTRSYKDFLTPALHRRFTRSALLLLAACYIESILMHPPSLLWVWNPFSFTGARAFLLLCPCLAVFIVRVANMHVGEKATASTADSVYRMMTSFNTAHTLGWYLWSAWFFSELYIWTRAPEAHLMWVDQGETYERPKLNENPIFLRTFLCFLAVVQTLLHWARGYDRVPVGEEEETGEVEEGASRIPDSIQKVIARLPTIGSRIIRLDFHSLVFWIPFYFIFIRHLVWPYFYLIGRALDHGLPEEARPTGIGIDNVFYFSWQCLSSAAMLTFLWELSNTVFTIYVCQPPLKREQPLTSELKDAQGVVVSKSKDPNGSLLSGLKSKKEVPKSFALWELWLICSRFDSRRKSIYTEVDRKDGSTWSQISKCCVDEIEAIKGRIDRANAPAKARKEHEANEVQKEQQDANGAHNTEDAFGMPHIADRKVLDGDVWQKSQRNDFAQNVGSIAKSFGQSPNAANPLAPRARRAIEWSRDHVLSKEDQERLSPGRLAREANGTMLQFLRSPFGASFRQKFGPATSAVLLGAPTSSKATVVLAARCLARLAVCSLKEDDYGQVAKSVAPILRAFTSTITAVDSYVATRAPHWTDVEFENRDRNVPEVAEVQAALRAGLEQVLLAFGEYASAIGVSKVELREARQALGSDGRWPSIASAS